MAVRTRIAPSPTGDPHLGTAYVALFNQALAKSRGGRFIVRIEDTDAARSTPAAEQAILDALRWLGIDWDEGPDVGGPHGPYRQSERLGIYRQHIDRLLTAGQAFHCFCTPQRLDEVRAAQRAAGGNPGYDGHCLNLAPDRVAERLQRGEAHVVRLRVPAAGACRFRDELRGAIEIPYSQVDMQVLLKADGFPTYHMAVVIDDHLMGITHILRGEEWISSVPKHRLLYGYLGWEMPAMVHLPLLRNPDRSKLSKRRNPTGIAYYRDQGYLPEALVNYLATMGWSMPDDREIFSRKDFQTAFDVSRIVPGGPVFDVEKLSWMNGQYLRQMQTGEFVDRFQAWAGGRERLEALAPFIQQRSERFADIAPQVDYLLGDRKPLATGDFEHRRLERDRVVEVLFRVARDFDRVRPWDRDRLHEVCRENARRMQLKMGDFLFPLFVAVSGRPVALPLFDSMAILGREVTRARLRDAMHVLGVSNKQKKRLEKLAADQVRGP